ncbi:MAG TPA: class I SAM-dependent methyltransferase [Terriglobales bacterium]|nr:class I SAM-dependent methyltransferase [Terriglobales bacterium]
MPNQTLQETPNAPSSLQLSAVKANYWDGERSARPTTGKAVLYALAKKLRQNEAVLGLMVRIFRALQRSGITLIPNHYYWPVPDIAELERREWPPSSVPVGFELNLQKQVEFLQQIVPDYAEETPGALESSGYHYNNGFFETVDAEIAYSVIRSHRPTRIVEVGGGFSTRILAAALEMNREQYGVEAELVTIDPFPERIPENLRARVELIRKPSQEIDLSVFLSLRAGDILCLDSSHVVSVGSDVVREYLEILPRLDSGVLIHAHDIFLPSDYPRDAVLKNLSFWSEQYLLQAFLTFNPQFEVLWAASAMQMFYPEILEQRFPQWKHSYREMPRDMRRFVPSVDGDRVWPSSFWMRRT